MKTTKASSISYIFRNFLFLLPITVLPAIILGISKSQQMDFSVLSFLIKFGKDTSGYVIDDFFLDVYRYFSCVDTSSNWLLWAVGILLAIVSYCIVIGMAERHMRLGARSYSKILRILNDTILFVLPYAFFVFLIYELCALIMCGMIFLLAKMGITAGALFALSVVITFVGNMIFIFIYELTMLTIPSMLTDGYTFNVAASYSARLISDNFGKVLVKIALPAVVTLVALTISRYILDSSVLYQPGFHFVVSFLFYLFWLYYLPCLSMSEYIRLTDGVRKDLQVKLF